MRTVKLIKASQTTELTVARVDGKPKTKTTSARDAVTNWVKDFQRRAPVHPREQFARLFD